MKMKSIASAISLMLCCAVMPLRAESVAHPSQGSAELSAASGLLVMGSVSVLAGSGQLVVGSIEATGDVVTVVLKGASEAGTASLQISREVAGAASLAVGTVVQVSADATGYALHAAGKLIAFIPNEVGKSLLYHARYDQRN